jgi:urease accessory protein
LFSRIVTEFRMSKKPYYSTASIFVAVAAFFSPSMAAAHPGHGADFHSGWMHPFMGIDHLLAMVAVGLLAVRIGGRGWWVLPAVFLGSMFVGGVAATTGFNLPGVEIAIMTSVLVLGVLLAAARVVPLWLGVGLVALFAFFHGHAHATEMVANGSLAPVAGGFLLATAVLHASGILAGMALAAWHRTEAVRFVGGAIAAAGAMMLVGWI